MPLTLVGGAQSAVPFDVVLRCSHDTDGVSAIRVERINLAAIRSGAVDQAVLP